jgi:hypothetical protein
VRTGTFGSRKGFGGSIWWWWGRRRWFLTFTLQLFNYLYIATYYYLHLFLKPNYYQWY